MGGAAVRRSTPGPPLSCPLSPAARQGRGFCPTSPSASSSRASLRGAAHPGRPLTPREGNQPALPSPPWQSSLPVHRDSSGAIRLELPSPGFVPPRASRAGSGWIQPWTRQRGRVVRGGFRGMLRARRAALLRSRLRWIPAPPLLLTHRAARCARHPARPLSSPFPIRREWRAEAAAAGRLWVTEESRRTGAGFSSAARCPRG